MRLVTYWEDILHYHVARTRALENLAQRRGHEVYSVAIRDASPELSTRGYQHLLGGRITVLASNSESASWNSLKSKRQMIQYLDKISPDVVAIVGYSSRVSRAALGWCRYHNRGAILLGDSQATDYARHGWKEWLKFNLIRCFDAAFVAGKPQYEYIQQLGIPHSRVFTGYDVVDNNFWSRCADQARSSRIYWRDKFGVPPRFFLTVCRFVPKKNVSGLISAYARYVKQHTSPWHLVVVGDGPLMQDLKTQVITMGLQDLVHFPGYFSANELGLIYGLASVFILASAHSEQWGLVVNESMAAGLPVLVSKVCGCSEDLVLEGVNGFSFNPKDELALSNLLTLMSSGDLDLDGMGTASRRHIEQFSPIVYAKNLLAASELSIQISKARKRFPWPPPLVWP